MKVKYTPHEKPDAQGHLFLDKLTEGACTIHLTGAASMTQAELDYYGRKIAFALSKEAPYYNG